MKAIRMAVMMAALLAWMSVLTAEENRHDTTATPRTIESYGKLPLSFELNRSQTDERVSFLSRGHGYTMFLAPTETVMVLRKSEGRARNDDDQPARSAAHQVSAAVRIELLAANPGACTEGVEELPGKANYFIGHDPTKWRTNVPLYRRVRFEDVYRGVDLIYYGNQRQLEYDFVVAPGADPRSIGLRFDGVSELRVDANGELVAASELGELRWHRPVVYQELDGMRHAVDGQYVLRGGHEVGFVVSAYDTSKPLVIDPVLAYSSFLGGSGDEIGFAVDIAVDAAGNAYVVGGTPSSDFPVTAGAAQTGFGGGGTCSDEFGDIYPCNDVYVIKLDPSGSTALYSTFLGGTGDDGPGAIAVDAAGNAYVMGNAQDGFPTTAGAYQTVYGGGVSDGFVAKLDASGSNLVYATYLGGPGDDVSLFGGGIAVDVGGNAYVTGKAQVGFPTTPGAFQTTYGGGPQDAFVSKLDASGSTLVFSTYLGGLNDFAFEENGRGVAVDAAGNVYVSGRTGSSNFPTTPGAFQTALPGSRAAFVTKLDPSGSTLVYSTLIGGSGSDAGRNVVVDSAGNAYVCGFANSFDFPIAGNAVQPTYGGGGHDAFVTVVDPTGSNLVYSTFLGGDDDDLALHVAIDTVGNAYVTGRTISTNFPTTACALQTSYSGGDCSATFGAPCDDTFLTKLNGVGSGLAFSTYLGGGGEDAGNSVGVDAAGNAYVAGTASPGFPTTPGAFQPIFGGGDNDDSVAKFILPVCSPDVIVWALGKRHNYLQTNSTTVVERPLHPWIAEATVVPTSADSVDSAFVGPKDRPDNEMDFENGGFDFLAEFDNPTDLDNAIPNGTYTVLMNTFHNGTIKGDLTVTGDAYPTAPPHINNFNAAQAINSAADFALTWDPFPGGTAADYIFVRVVFEFAGVPTIVTNSCFQNQPCALNGTATQFVIKAGTLQPNTNYFAEVGFFHAVDVNTTAYPGVPGYGAYATTTEVPISTGGGQSPSVQIAELIVTIQAMALPSAMKTSLTAKLKAALTDLSHHDPASACTDLANFITQVNAQKGKKITLVQANQLIASALQIETALGCP